MTKRKTQDRTAPEQAELPLVADEAEAAGATKNIVLSEEAGGSDTDTVGPVEVMLPAGAPDDPPSSETAVAAGQEDGGPVDMVGLMRDALMSCPADVEVPTLIDIKVDGVARRHILTPIPKLALERALAVYMRERPTGSPQEFLSMCEGLTGERGSVQYRTVARMSL